MSLEVVDMIHVGVLRRVLSGRVGYLEQNLRCQQSIRMKRRLRMDSPFPVNLICSELLCEIYRYTYSDKGSSQVLVRFLCARKSTSLKAKVRLVNRNIQS